MLLIQPINKDNTIYEQYPYMNTGGDPILEIGVNKDKQEKRILLHFDINDIENRLLHHGATAINEIFLNIKVTNSNNQKKYPFNYNIGKLNDEFEEGTQLFLNYINNKYNSSSLGSSWENKNTNNMWNYSGADYTYYSSASIYEKNPNIRENITTLYNDIKDNNNGIILYPPNTEDNSYLLYSKETHLNNRPYLDIDINIPNKEFFYSGNISQIKLSESPHVYSYQNPNIISEGSVQKFNFKCREKYPTINTYTTESILNITSLIENTSLCYRINNKTNNNVYVPFGVTTPIYYSGSNGYYFYIDFTNFPINTYYSIDILAIDNNDLNNQLYYKNVLSFKVE